MNRFRGIGVSITEPEMREMKRQQTRQGLIFFLFLGFVGIPSLHLRAQAIIAPSGRTLFHRGTLIRTFLQVEHLSLRADGQSEEVTRYIAPLAIVYGFYPKWTVIAIQPYMSVDRTNRMGSATTAMNLNGLPDSRLFVQYDGLYSRNSPGGLTRLAGVLGIQLPTGADRFSTGSLAYTGGLIFEKAMRLKYVFTADFQYTFTTANTQGLKVGNRARFDVVPAYFLISEGKASPDASWVRKMYDRLFRNGAYFILEFNGTWQAHARQGNDIANTGGTTLSISPGIQYFLSDRFLAEFSAPIPVIKELNGTQLEPDSTFLFGFRVLF